MTVAMFGATLAVFAAGDQLKRQVYPLNPQLVKTNAAKVENDLKNAPESWKKSPILYYAVSPLSDIKRVPDCYPSDGQLAAPLRIIAAKGEFEPASFVVYAKKNFDKVQFIASDLKSQKGATIPAAALDMKLVKVWYQCGSGWFGYMADPLRRTLTPEMLLNDENLIWVDGSTEDNYAWYTNADGSRTYEWISADFQVTNYRFTNMVRIAQIKDADTLQPVVLNKDEFKQFMVTIKVPKNAQDGTYTGNIKIIADGKDIGVIPVNLGVFPFELPDPATNYDINKPFMLNLYGTGGAQHYPKILQNLIDHNSKVIGGFPNVDPSNEKQFAKEVELAKKLGVITDYLFSGPGVGLTADVNNPEQMKNVEALQKRLDAAAAMCKKYLGHSNFFSYGADEGGYWTIRAERPAWRAAHAAGANVMVSAHNHKRMLYPLDYMVLPRMPSEERKSYVKKFHESHPNGLAGWYADPHSGPENPDYFRRIHGIMSYKADYDVASNYTWYRNDWNDFAIAYEPNYRGIIMVYASNDRILDTLAWEGIREGLDDIRYATKVKQLALLAEKSGNADVLNIGRKALGFIAYWDTREDVDTFRMECVNYILQLEKALNSLKK